jgi:BMFP domain-containing protein YqiC
VEKMINAFMDEFQKNIPPALYDLKEVISAHVRSTAETIIKKMDLVSREEFDTQLLVLRRAHQKLAELEEKLDHLALVKDKKTTAKTKAANKSVVNKKGKGKTSTGKEGVKTNSTTKKKASRKDPSASKK